LIRFNVLWHHNVGWLNPSLAACASTRVIEHVNAVALELTWWLPAWILAFMVYYCLRIGCDLGHPIDISSLLLAFVAWLLWEKDCFVKRWLRTNTRHLWVNSQFRRLHFSLEINVIFVHWVQVNASSIILSVDSRNPNGFFAVEKLRASWWFLPSDDHVLALLLQRQVFEIRVLVDKIALQLRKRSGKDWISRDRTHLVEMRRLRCHNAWWVTKTLLWDGPVSIKVVVLLLGDSDVLPLGNEDSMLIENVLLWFKFLVSLFLRQVQVSASLTQLSLLVYVKGGLAELTRFRLAPLTRF